MRPPSSFSLRLLAEPDGDGELAAFEMLDDAALEARFLEISEHRLVGEAEPDMGVAAAQFLALVRREIDDQQPAAGTEQPRRLGHRGGRILRVMEHLVEDHRVAPRPTAAAAHTCRPGEARRDRGRPRRA